MSLQKKVLSQEGFPSCGRTFFHSNIWKSLLSRLSTEERSFAAPHGRRFFRRHDFSTHGRTFFYMFTRKKVLPWMRNHLCRRRFFRRSMRKNVLPWLRKPTYGRTFFRMWQMLHLLRAENGPSVGSRGRTFFRRNQRKNHLLHEGDRPSIACGRRFFHTFTWTNLLLLPHTTIKTQRSSTLRPFLHGCNPKL